MHPFLFQRKGTETLDNELVLGVFPGKNMWWKPMDCPEVAKKSIEIS
jgi:hypothetical protein